jgi:hypothetical protein
VACINATVDRIERLARPPEIDSSGPGEASCACKPDDMSPAPARGVERQSDMLSDLLETITEPIISTNRRIPGQLADELDIA